MEYDEFGRVIANDAVNGFERVQTDFAEHEVVGLLFDASMSEVKEDFLRAKIDVSRIWALP